MLLPIYTNSLLCHWEALTAGKFTLLPKPIFDLNFKLILLIDFLCAIISILWAGLVCCLKFCFIGKK